MYVISIYALCSMRIVSRGVSFQYDLMYMNKLQRRQEEKGSVENVTDVYLSTA